MRFCYMERDVCQYCKPLDFDKNILYNDGDD